MKVLILSVEEERRTRGGVILLAAGFFLLGLGVGWTGGRKLFKRKPGEPREF